MRIFSYCRVSTADQTTDNQLQEIAAAGFVVEPQRVIAETVSGSVACSQRSGFQSLLNKLENGDVLVVTKIDRLGRDVIDVATTVAYLEGRGVKVHCLALGGADLTSSAGKLIMGIVTAFAQFERDQIIERTQAGLSRAKAAGKTLGRKPALSKADRKTARDRLAQGESVASVARDMKVSRQTIMRVRDS